MLAALRVRVAGDLRLGEKDERTQFRSGTAPGGEPPKGQSEFTPVAGKPARHQRPQIGLHIPPVRSPLPFLVGALSREWDQGTAFLFMPVFLGCGAAAYFALPQEPKLSAILAGAGALATAAWLSRHRFAVCITVLAALTSISGMLAGKTETLRHSAIVTGSAVTTQLTGMLVSLERQASGRIRFVIDVKTTARPHLRYQPARVRVTAGAAPAGLQPGDRIAGRIRLLPPPGPVRPGGYDFSFKSYFDGYGAIGFFLGRPRLLPATGPEPFHIRSSIQRIRDGLTRRIAARIGGEEGKVAAALVTGEKGAIGDDTEEILRTTGLAHILSISGLHMALVAGSVAGFLRSLFALFPDFAARYPVRKYAACAALLAVSAYLLVSGAGIATRRSFVMLAVMLVALLFDRAALTLRNLAIAALVVIALQPHEIAGPGFQMSFAATAALVSAYAAWSRWRTHKLAGREHRQTGPARQVGRYAGALVFTSLIAGAATTIYAVYHFQRVAPLGIIANLAAMPVVSLVVMPAAVAAHVLIPFDLDGPLFRLMGWGIGIVLAIAHDIAARSPADMAPAISRAAMLAMSAGLILATLFAGVFRILAVPFFTLGALLALDTNRPAVMISEDARLVAVDLGNGRLAVNRNRPSRFAIENWQRAFAAATVVKPAKVQSPDELVVAVRGWTNSDRAVIDQSAVPIVGSPPAALPTSAAAGFLCTKGLCVARAIDGALIVHASHEAQARTFCRDASLIVIADATATQTCGRRDPAVVLTARDLARKGAASIWYSVANAEIQRRGSETGTAALSRGPNLSSDFDPTATGPPPHDIEILPTLRPVIRFAVSEPYRPWHAHRAFSRAARGLAPWKPRRKHSAAASAKQPVSTTNP